MIREFSKYTVNNIPCSMVYVEGGTMELGEWDGQHIVTIPSFYLGKYQVTQALYEAVVENNPSRIKGKNRPVTDVNWNEAKFFIEKLNKETGQEFRLPSESEWEYAARGGVHSEGFEYCGGDNLKQVGWYKENAGRETKPVGLLLPNELGLYDMSGNAWDWCEDDWHRNFRDEPNKNGSPWIDGKTITDRAAKRVVRGGGFGDNADFCRSDASSFDYPPNYFRKFIGIRVVLSPFQ